MRSFTCAAASQPPWLALGAFVVHYRGHKHVRLRNLLPRGKKTLFVQSSLRATKQSSEKKRDIRSYQIPFPASFPNLFSLLEMARKKSDHFHSKSTIKNVYTILTLRHSKNRLVFLLKQPVLKKGKLCAKLLRALECWRNTLRKLKMTSLSCGCSTIIV